MLPLTQMASEKNLGPPRLPGENEHMAYHRIRGQNSRLLAAIRMVGTKERWRTIQAGMTALAEIAHGRGNQRKRKKKKRFRPRQK